MFRKSLFFMEKEKLSVLVKELKSPFLISDFYANESNSESSEKKDLEEDFLLLTKEIEFMRERIIANYNNLEEQMSVMENNPSLYEIQSLIYLSILREYIKFEIDNIGKVNEKISQLLRDGYNQYLPKPVLGKRFSSVNITSQVENSLTQRLKEISEQNSQGINSLMKSNSLIVWDYTENYRIVEKENFTSFRLSYWYFEFSYFLPNLTHEIGHKLLDTNEYKELQSNLEQNIKNLSNKENFPLIQNKIRFKYIPSTLSKEILADMIAFFYHGSSFFYALSHKFFSSGLDTRFKANEEGVYNLNHEIINTSNIQIKTSFDFYSRYRFEDKKDFVFLRLSILIFLEQLILDSDMSEEIKKKFKLIDPSGIKRLVNSIYKLDDEMEYSFKILSDLESIFLYGAREKEQKAYSDTALSVKMLYKQITEFLNKNQENYVFKYINNEKIENKSEYDEISIHFNDIWSKRFNALNKGEKKAVHRFEYRKKLHKSTIFKLIKNGLLSIENLKPYNMVFFKYNLDSLSSTYGDELTLSTNNGIEQGLVLGIYDYVSFRKLDSEYSVNIIDFKPKEYEEKSIKYYESSYSLIKIMDDTINTRECSKEYHLNAIIQIEVPKTLNNNENVKDIYEDLFGNLEKIKDIFEKEELKYGYEYSKVEYFKSLGPKDITIKINSASIQFIFNIKKKLAIEFKRTFTTLYLNNQSSVDIDIYSTIKSCKRYTFVSNLRMNPEYNHQKFESLCQSEQNIEKVAHKTGVMDFQIAWKSNITFQTVIDFYTKILSEKMVVDIQSGIDKNINLHICSCEIC